MSLCIGNFNTSIFPESIKEASGVTQKKYGVKFDGINSAGVRTYDAAKFVWTPSTNTVKGKDSFNGIPMFTPKECITQYDEEIGKQKVISYKGDDNFQSLKDDKIGDVMMEFTKFYYYRPSETEWILSPDYIFGFKPAPAFYRNGEVIDKIYISKYDLGVGFVSQSGVETLTNTNMDTFRSNLRVKGMYMWDLKWWETLKMLCLVKYANCDVQACNARGYDSGSRSYPSGNADNVLGLDGSATSKTENEAALCFGLENPYGNVWTYLDGTFSYQYYLYHKDIELITEDPKSVSDLSTYDKMNEPVPGGMSQSEIKTLMFNTSYDYITAPKTCGDGPYNDNCWSTAGLNLLLVGGSAWNGVSAGLFTFYVGGAVGYLSVYFGARAMWF